ncbi:MAG: hypothetical protein NZ526_08265 [Aquificaceae bacterium]|nr:hypothetical protein [Aquificaceae bacterium]
MLERKVGNITLNTNLVYIKASHVEELRDAYGAYLHAYGDLRKWLIAGVEFKYLIPEEESVDKKDMHVLVGFVLRPAENTDISLGLHRSLNKHESFSKYGVLLGFLRRF